MGQWEREKTESREARGRWRAKIEKQNGRESLGIFRLKLKLKRCVSHLFFFFYLNFGPYWCQYDLNRPISMVSDNTNWFSPNQRKSAQVGTNRETKKKKMRRGTNTQAVALPATHYIKRRCSTPVATSMLRRVFPLFSSYTIWSWVDCGPTRFVLATIPTHLCFSI